MTKLKQDTRNANKGTKEGMDILKQSINSVGIGRPVVVDADNSIIAGNKTSMSVGGDALVVDIEADELLVVVRTDLDITDPKARIMAILDNRASEINLDWDGMTLAQIAREVGVENIGFTKEELETLTSPGGFEAVSSARPDPPEPGDNVDLKFGKYFVSAPTAKVVEFIEEFREHCESIGTEPSEHFANLIFK